MEVTLVEITPIWSMVPTFALNPFSQSLVVLRLLHPEMSQGLHGVNVADYT